MAGQARRCQAQQAAHRPGLESLSGEAAKAVGALRLFRSEKAAILGRVSHVKPRTENEKTELIAAKPLTLPYYPDVGGLNRQARIMRGGEGVRRTNARSCP